MENKFTSIKERALYVAENHDVTKEQFCEKIGMTYGNFKGKAKETPLNSDAIANILTMYPDVDPLWLITGRGSMTGSIDIQKMEIKEIGNNKIRRKKESQQIPLYNIRATAGLVEVINGDNKHIPIDYIQIPNMPECDGGIPITGDSMYPLLKSGDIALYKEVHDKGNIIWGEIYLIAIVHNGDQFTLTKFLQKAERPGFIKLVSENRHHQDMEFPIESVKALAQIKGHIRMYTSF